MSVARKGQGLLKVFFNIIVCYNVRSQELKLNI